MRISPTFVNDAHRSQKFRSQLIVPLKSCDTGMARFSPKADDLVFRPLSIELEYSRYSRVLAAPSEIAHARQWPSARIIGWIPVIIAAACALIVTFFCAVAQSAENGVSLENLRDMVDCPAAHRPPLKLNGCPLKCPETISS
jgi:hypothetical protein